MISLAVSGATILLNLYLLTYLTGCTFLAFADSSAMRVEVEVYKGPLSLEPEIQFEELYGYLLEAHTGVLRTFDFSKLPKSDLEHLDAVSQATLRTVQTDSLLILKKLQRSICAFSTDSNKCQNEALRGLNVSVSDLPMPNVQIPPNASGSIRFEDLDEQTRYKFNEVVARRSLRLWAAEHDVFEMNIAGGKYSNLSPTDLEAFKKVLTDISRTAAAMQAAAFRYATASTAGQPFGSFARIAATYFIEAASEYGNQLEARADALLKQLGLHGHDRRELPLTTHLRESGPTDFLHLFEWMDAHMPRVLDYLTFNWSPDVTDRIKIIERLYADHFWSKINTVYASGRGKTQMAFIKDETGNWNLKSFDNDPTELLDAYTEVAKTALKKAAEAAAAGATGGGSEAAKKFIELAVESEAKINNSNQQTTPAGTLSLGHLRTRLMGNLNPAQFKAVFEKEDELLRKVRSREEESAEAQKGDKDSLKQSADKALADARADLAQHRHQVVTRWETIINDHSNLVDILSSSVKKK